MKKIWSNVWIIGIVSGALATLLADFLKQIPLFSTLKTIPGLLLLILTFKISLWIILTVLFIGCLFIYLYLKFNKEDESPNFPFLAYKEDQFKTKWKWDWELNSLKKWEIVNLRTYCSNCNTRLAYSQGAFSDATGKCPKCETMFGVGMLNPIDNLNDVKLMIYDKIEKLNS